MSFSGVGGSEVSSTLGTYRISLGPTIEGNYYKVYCTAMDTVTDEFPEFVMESVKEETISYLPNNVCVFPVSLLLGMKDPTIQPILRCVLPSGLAVYKSRFTDMYSSNLIFGGTHPSFSLKSGHINNIILHLNSLSGIRSLDPHSGLEASLMIVLQRVITMFAKHHYCLRLENSS